MSDDEIDEWFDSIDINELNKNIINKEEKVENE
jgi:hypothetical protein